jgi:hypothetical protein
MSATTTTINTTSNTFDLNTSHYSQWRMSHQVNEANQNKNISATETIDLVAQTNLKEITNSIGDIIKILKSSSSSNSASNSENNGLSLNQQNHIKLHALKTEIDKTMSEISKFKSEVSTRILHHQNLNENSNNILLTKYEKNLLKLLNNEQNSSITDNESFKSQIDIGINTDISMQNTIFTINYSSNNDLIHFRMNKINNQDNNKSKNINNIKIDELLISESTDTTISKDHFKRQRRTLTPIPIIESPETSK